MSRKCRACKATYEPRNSLQKACSIMCAMALAKIGRERAERRERQEDRKAQREAKQRIKTRSQWMREAQAAWNRYVRARDYGKPCASCGAMPAQKFGGTMDCSHYRSVGSAPHLRFHLHNAAAACVRCNRELSGNIVELRKGLIERIGVEKVEAVERDQSVRKFDIAYLARIKRIFTKRALRLEKCSREMAA